MVFKYMILLYGLLEFIFGCFLWFKKSENIVGMFIQSISIFSNDIKYNEIEDKAMFSRWFGEVIMITGCLYIFLAAVSITFGIKSLMIILFIILIEGFFMKVILSGCKKFI
ncbi:hypothetical protein [Clostridium sp.]|uniref:hypothetical protein n=1 Tax=Clostridium sp. TaxID=1506 RepID=UPI003F2FB2C4